jgi:hypothetical protein
VTAVQTQTNFTFEASTNNEGIFRIQSLQPGTYRVTFAAAAFKGLVRENIIVRTGDVLPVDATLEVGSTTEQIEVTARSTLLETETSSSSTINEGETLYKLPMYQRYIPDTLNLVPGATTLGYSVGTSISTYSVNGQRATGTAIFEDGVLGQSPVESSGNAILSLQAATEEVRVLTGTLPAEYGHSASGVVDVVKKSGANALHGSVGDYGRTRSMTHRQFFNMYKTSQPQPGAPDGVPAWFQEPDTTVSGPIVIPKLYNGRNKTFFYFGWMKLIEKKSNANTAQTPSAAEKGGDFSFGGLGNPLYDPLSTRQLAAGTWARDLFPNMQIPLSRFDPVSARIIAINPWQPANLPGSFSSTGPVSNYAWELRSRTFHEYYNGRVDHQVNAKLKAYGSYTYNHQSGHGRPGDIAIPVFDGIQGNLTPWTQQNASAGFSYILNSTTFNDARVGYYRNRNDTIVPSYGGNWPSQLGIPNDNPALMPAFAPTGQGSAIFSNVYSNEVDPNYLYGININGPTRSIATTVSFRDDLSRITGKHAFKMGYEILHFRANYVQTGTPSGIFQFTNTTAGLQPNGQPVPNTGNYFAGFEVGAVQQATFSEYLTSWLPEESVNSLYFQDDWKFSPNLTLNLGLRWSTESPYETQNGLKSEFSPTTVDPLTGKMGAIIHPTGPLSQRYWKNFQPRFGLAWHFLPKSVLRGGFGFNTVDVRWPNSFEQFDEYQALDVQARAPGDPRPMFQLSQGPQPIVYNTLSNDTALYVGTNYGSRTAAFMDSHLHPGYVMNWNLTIEHQLTTNNMLKLTYQGSASVDLLESWNINAFPTNAFASNFTQQNQVFAAVQNYLPYPQFGSINYMSNSGHATYHSGTAQFQKRASVGLVLDAFYTFSKVIDDCDSDSVTCTGVEPVSGRNLNKGRAGYDRNNRFVASATYQLPVGVGRHFLNHKGIFDYIAGGWSIAWIQTVSSGNPLSFSYAGNPSNEWPTSIGAQLPNIVPGCNTHMNAFGLGNEIGGNRFNQALENPVLNMNCFAYPAAFTPGNAGRNIVTGAGLLFSQASATKNFKLGERFNLEFRFDFQNPFHNYNFNTPTTQVDFRNPQLFGKITADQVSSALGGEPLMDLNLRLSW